MAIRVTTGYAAGDRSALSEAAQRGLALFQGKAGCGQCHADPNLTDEEFHNTGVAFRSDEARRTSMLIDEGRFAVTQTPVDRGAFKTPVLNACRTAHCSKGGGAALRLVEGGANTLC